MFPISCRMFPVPDFLGHFGQMRRKFLLLPSKTHRVWFARTGKREFIYTPERPGSNLGNFLELTDYIMTQSQHPATSQYNTFLGI